MCLSSELSCEAESFFCCCLNPHRCFQSEVWGFISPGIGTLGCSVCLTPQLFLPVYLHVNVGPPCPPATALPTQTSSCCLTAHPLCPSCLSPPLLPVWINVSSLTPWLSDFHTVWFSVSSGCFLLLILLLSFFWLCEEAQCVYLHFHLGQKSQDSYY